MFYWVTFHDRTPGTVEGSGRTWELANADARRRADALGQVASFRPLPYPRNPKIDVRSDCPAFCQGYAECVGLTACPRAYACSE